MFNEAQSQIVNDIGGELFGLLEGDAARITAEAEVGDGYARTSIEFEPGSDEESGYIIDDMPEVVHEISEAFIDLRDAMITDGQEPWHGITFVVDRNGNFDVGLSYQPPDH